jgi:predicted secreted protein
MKRRLIVLGLAVVVLAAAGVAVYVTVRSEPVEVDLRASRNVSVPAGERLRVDLGEINTSVGDAWFLTQPPGAAVLRDVGRDYTTADSCEEGWSGCDQTLVWEFAAVSAGQTSMRFQYCYRSRPPGCEPAPTRPANDPLTLTVTVTRS